MERSPAQLMKAYTDSRDGLWAKFGVTSSMEFPISDFTNRSWSLERSGEVYIAKTDESEVSFETAEYEGELYGTSQWDAEGFTMVVVFNNGDTEAWLLTSDRRVEEA